LLSLGLILVIGFQGKIRNNFLKALFHAFLSILCMAVASSVLLPIFTGGKLSDVPFCFYVSIAAFSILFPSSSPELLSAVLSWGIFLLLLALSLWGIRKFKVRSIRIGGQILTILVFGGFFILCFYHTLKAVVSAIARMYK